jgi:copper homeostasis protein CutC
MNEFMQKIKRLEDTINSLISPKALRINVISSGGVTEDSMAKYFIENKRVEIHYSIDKDSFQIYIQENENTELEIIFEGELEQFDPRELLNKN